MDEFNKEWKENLLSLLGSGYDHTNAQGQICSSDCRKSYGAKDVASIVTVFIEDLLSQHTTQMREEIKKIKVVDLPPKQKMGSLTTNQVFVAGQMNLLLRAEEILETL